MHASATIENDGRILVINIPMVIRHRGGRKEIILPTGNPSSYEPTPLQYALGRAFRWQKMLDSGEVASISELARTISTDKSFIAKQIRLTLLAPDIIRAILNRNEPDSLTLVSLFESVPVLWDEQRKLFGFPPL